MRKEYLVKNKVKSCIKQLGGVHCMPMGTGFGNAGYGDIIACVAGCYIEIECKSGNNKPTALQLQRQKIVSAAGGLALIVNETNVSQLKEVIESWVGRKSTSHSASANFWPKV